jgi:single-stranded DNA-binding protein
VEIILGQARRRWSEDEKRALVAETFADGQTVNAWQFIRATAFSETAQSELLLLLEGDALAVTGPLKAELYTAQNGETKIALSIIADKVLPLKKPSKEREVKLPDARSRQDAPYRGGAAAFDDSIPFGVP